jgi:hypothetical protein
MGLDGVMIVMSVEDTFGIKITDLEASKLRTPDQLSAFVAERVQALPDEQCITQQIYYRLRRAFRTAIPALAADVRLESRLDRFLHRDQWPQAWAAVRAAAEVLEWPEQVRWPRLLNLNTGPKTIRDLVWHVAIALTPPRGQRPPRWTKQQVAHAVRRIILEESGVGLALDGKKSFPDLGID